MAARLLRYILQSRNKLGHIISLGSFDRLITPEEAVQQFGPNDYTLKSVSPRFKVQWKHKHAHVTVMPEGKIDEIRSEVQKLGRTTKLHTYGIIGLGAVTAVGLGLSHLRFSNSEARIARLEAIAATLTANGLQCPNCQAALEYMLQNFCGSCGTHLLWPNTLPTFSSNMPVERCRKCQGEMRLQQNYCPRCGSLRQPSVQFFQPSQTIPR